MEWAYINGYMDTRPEDLEENIRNQDYDSPTYNLEGDFTSPVELHSGVVMETHSLPSYQSNGMSRGITLTYDSLRADPRPIAHFGYDDINTSTLDSDSRLMADIYVWGNNIDYQVPGFAGGQYGLDGGEHFWSLPTTGSSIDISAALQAEMIDPDTGLHFASGRYKYDLTSGIVDFYCGKFVGDLNTQIGEFVHVNSIDSIFGSGWGIAGLEEIILNQDGSLLLVDGGGEELVFEPPENANDPYVSPKNDFSVLTRLTDGSFTRVTKEQTKYEFRPDGKIESVTDRNSNKTTYVYDLQGNLIEIVDPVGLRTTLTYNFMGKVKSITDPANRQTTLDYDGDGNLIEITNPDATSRTLTYDTQHHLISETDRRGNTQTTTYDQFGRAESGVRRDNTNVAIDPLQTQIVLDPTATIDPLNSPQATVETQTPKTSYTDANGNVIDSQVDRGGQNVNSIDPIGTRGNVVRNENTNFVTSTVDPLGNIETFTPDGLNNIVSSQETIINPLGSSQTVTESYTYDLVFNQLTSYTDELGHQTLYDIDPLSGNVLQSTRVVSGGNIEHSYTYDNNGLIDTVTDPLGRVTKYDYDPYGRVEQITLALGTPDAATISYEYDSAGNQTAVTDENSNRTEYQYDEFNRLIEVKEANPGNGLGSPVTTYDYDEAGNLIEIVDPRNKTTTHTYDRENRLESTTDANQKTTFYEYDGNGNIVKVIDAEGRVTTSTYDGRNRLTASTYTLNGSIQQTTYIYDINDNLVSVTDPENNTTSYTYDSRDRLVKEEDAENNTIIYEYDGADNLIALVDPEGNRTRYQYDEANRQIKIINAYTDFAIITYDRASNVVEARDELNRKTEFTYDNRDRPIIVENDLSDQIRTKYDGVGNVIEISDELNRTTRYTYDALNRQIEVIDPLLHSIEYQYDESGNLIRFFDGKDNQTEYSYDNLNRLIEERNDEGKTVISEYDNVGNVTKITDQLNRSTTFTYNELNLATSVDTPLNPPSFSEYDDVGNLVKQIDPLGNEIEYQYDRIYRLSAVIDEENRPPTVYTYDRASNLLSITDPEQNTTSYTYDDLNRMTSETNQLGLARTYGYDKVGNLISLRDRNGRVIEYDYDRLNRLRSETWVGDSYQAVYDYNEASELINASDNYSSYSYDYDLAGRLIQTDNVGTIGVPNVVFDYGYDAANNMIGTTDTIDGVLSGIETYSYDTLNRVTSITQSGLNIQDKRVDYQYDSASQRDIVRRYGDLTGTQLIASTDYTFDLNGRLTDLDHSNNNGAIAFYDYTYDADNRITEFASPEGVSIYNYDKTDQLTEADHNYQVNEEYTYDDNGNRTNPNYVTGLNNRLDSDGVYNYEYDPEGNLVKRTEIATNEVFEYEWDYRNRLVGITVFDSGGNVIASHEYTYDINGNRIAKSVDSNGDGTAEEIERYVLDGAEIALVFDGAGNQTERFFYGIGIDEVLAVEEPGTVYWSLSDQQGSVRVLLDDVGNTVNQISYDAFGNITNETDPSIDFRFTYTGRELDEETGQYYYRARYYDPMTGRFINEDLIGFDGGDTNLYRYVGNSPTLYTDPSGQMWLDIAYNTLDVADQYFAGFASTVTLGRSDSWRESLYGDLATRNHDGFFYGFGKLGGAVTGLGLGIATGGAVASGTAISGGLGWGTLSAVGYQAATTGVGAYDSMTNIIEGDATGWDALGFVDLAGFGLGRLSKAKGVANVIDDVGRGFDNLIDGIFPSSGFRPALAGSDFIPSGRNIDENGDGIFKPFFEAIWSEGKFAKPSRKNKLLANNITPSVLSALKHWGKHKSDFPHIKNAREYVETTKDFLNNPPSTALTKILSTGEKAVYDPISDVMGFTTSDKVTPATMYIPKPDTPGIPLPPGQKPRSGYHRYASNLDYFHAQK